MLLIISEDRNPALCQLLGVIHRDMGVPSPGPSHFVIPGECALYLDILEEAASQLSREKPAPEDRDATEALLEGEASRYLDSEMATFAVGDPSVAEAIAARLPGGRRLLHMVDCVKEYLDKEITLGRRYGGDGI